MTIDIEATVKALQIVPDPGPDKRYPIRGRKAILVGDVRWGTVTMEMRGVHGAFYYIEDIDGRIGKELPRHGGGTRKIEVYVCGDKGAKRDAGWKEAANVKPVADRIFDKVAEMIRDGSFRSPDTIRDLNAKASAEYRAERDKRADAEAAEFNAKADAIVGNIPVKGVTLRDAESLRDQIVAAMRWARTK